MRARLKVLLAAGILMLVAPTAFETVSGGQKLPWPNVGEDPIVTPVVGPSWLTHRGITLRNTSLGKGAGRYGPGADQADGIIRNRSPCTGRFRSGAPICIDSTARRVTARMAPAPHRRSIRFSLPYRVRRWHWCAGVFAARSGRRPSRWLVLRRIGHVQPCSRGCTTAGIACRPVAICRMRTCKSSTGI